MADQKALILAVNAGSSSLKISLFQRDSHSNVSLLLLSSNFNSLSSPPSDFSFSYTDKAKAHSAVSHRSLNNVHDHAAAFTHFLHHLSSHADADLHPDAIRYVCHRIVHGGDIPRPLIVSREAYHHIERLTSLAPLHNAAALAVVHATLDRLPHARSVAYFDTTFHRSIPAHIAAYALDPRIASERGIQKYGFHGLSYAYVLRAVAAHLGKPESTLNLIVAHLGSGASMCAIRAGHSLDTTMGLTPLSGLPGATRSGSLDPAAIFHYSDSAGETASRAHPAPDVAVTVTEAEETLNTKAGWAALAGTTDFGAIARGRAAGDAAKTLAFELVLDRVLGYLGAYHVKLAGRVDALVFAGGVGEKSGALREAVVGAAACLGFALDGEANENVGKGQGPVVEIGKGGEGGGKKVLVCFTDEQEEMARECARESEFWT